MQTIRQDLRYGARRKLKRFTFDSTKPDEVEIVGVARDLIAIKQRKGVDQK